jgi:hypothetical protein
MGVPELGTRRVGPGLRHLKHTGLIVIDIIVIDPSALPPPLAQPKKDKKKTV